MKGAVVGTTRGVHIFVAVYSEPVPSAERDVVKAVVPRDSPRGMTAIGVFFFFGALMASLAGTTLLWPGTVLDRMWALNPNAYEQLAPLGRTVGSVFLALSGALAAAGVGWFKRRVWGWGLAVVIIATQVAGDWVTIFMGQLVRGGVGVVIAGALLFYILRPRVREAFRRGAGLSTL
ncbi:MAG: hypothetical protein LAO56_24970 [Acidobacteriia bacterium]|nr:hypothetical protein [Terriglobia bacterium]